jgi:hypothetical protein
MVYLEGKKKQTVLKTPAFLHFLSGKATLIRSVQEKKTASGEQKINTTLTRHSIKN